MAADKDYLGLPLAAFLADLAAKSPTPGGGSVAALVGALAAAQARMVVEYTIGKPRSAEHDSRLREVLAELTRGQDMFRQLMSEDMAAYERYAAARKSGDPDERQRALATATAVPTEIVALATAVLACLDEIRSLVNPHLASDLRVAAVLALAVARSAAFNVRVNLGELADQREAEGLSQQVDRLLRRAGEHCSAVTGEAE